MYGYFRVAYNTASLLHHTRWSQERLLNHQNERIREIVRYAYDHVPFYHDKFESVGMRPADVQTVQDLNKLPIIRRDELQKNLDNLISDEYDPKKLLRVSTSGSTGKPLFTSISRSEDALRKAKLLRANIICGQKPRDKWVVITAPQHEAHMRKLQRLLGIYAPIPISVFDHVASQVSEINKIKPDVLDGYSSSIHLLAREVERSGVDTIKPKFIVGGAELIDRPSRHYVEKVFNAPFYDQYACVELERLAWQCKERSEHHIDADTVFMQFVDERGEDVGVRETGEIVCTSFFNYAMPFIRYATGDIGRASEKTECDCGVVFPMMSVLEGRKEAIVTLPDGRSLSPLAIGDCMCAFKYFDQVLEYRFIQEKIDFFRILIKKKDHAVEDIAMRAELQVHIRETLNLGNSEATIEVEFKDEIPPDGTGKIRKVVSELRDA